MGRSVALRLKFMAEIARSSSTRADSCRSRRQSMLESTLCMKQRALPGIRLAKDMVRGPGETLFRTGFTPLVTQLAAHMPSN